MKIWLKIVFYFILAMLILILPMAIYSFTEQNSLIYGTIALLVSALIALKLGKVI